MDYANDPYDAVDAEWEENEYTDETDEFAPQDPFEGLTRREQDLFFRVLDLMPREQLEYAMDYFMSHPDKIRAVVDYVKQEKELIKNNDVQALQELFEKERIVIQQVEAQAEGQ